MVKVYVATLAMIGVCICAARLVRLLLLRSDRRAETTGRVGDGVSAAQERGSKGLDVGRNHETAGTKDHQRGDD
jgi:hypothetical protein